MLNFRFQIEESQKVNTSNTQQLRLNPNDPTQISKLHSGIAAFQTIPNLSSLISNAYICNWDSKKKILIWHLYKFISNLMENPDKKETVFFLTTEALKATLLIQWQNCLLFQISFHILSAMTLFVLFCFFLYCHANKSNYKTAKNSKRMRNYKKTTLRVIDYYVRKVLQLYQRNSCQVCRTACTPDSWKSETLKMRPKMENNRNCLANNQNS